MSLSGSDLSSLSSAPPSDEEPPAMDVDKPVGITKYFKKEAPPSPPPKREPSPPHEYVLADNPNIAFIVMFRARFHDVFPRSAPHFGPQDIEKGAVEQPPGDYIERLLCALLGMVLNRKKEVERNHYTRPLEEAIQTHAPQWPKEWEGRNPLRGGNSFATLSPEGRILLLKSLAIWSLSSSEAVQAKIKESYKQARHDDDLNQPLSVQPWGRDGLKRRYWLIEGMDDTHFRLYRESNPALKTVTWWSVAGSIPELRGIAERLGEERSTNSKKLRDKINVAIPRFEASEEKRKRRDYRLARKAAFTRPEPGFSLYEGRTRGKKLKYTFDDEEDIFSDGLPSTRRSTRNASGISTPGEPEAPKFSASGRQVRTRAGAMYGATLLAGQRGDESVEENAGRPRRTRTSTRANGYTDYNMADDMGDASDTESSSENEWQGDDEEDDNDNELEGEEEGDAMSEDGSKMDGENPSLVVQLKYGGKQPSGLGGLGEEPSAEKPETEAEEEAGPGSDAKTEPPQTQQSMVDGPQDVMQEDLPKPHSKEPHTLAVDNTGAGGSVEGQDPTLPNGLTG